MWPWGHLAAGYLLYSIGYRIHSGRPPDGFAAIALAVGTQFPDLVDKPLAWTFGVLPNGRSLTHSLLVAALIITVLEVVLRRRNDGSIASAFGVGYVSHLLGDALQPALAGEYNAMGFLVWPFGPQIVYSTEPSFSAHIGELALTPSLVFELALGGLVFLLWLYDGAPGIGVVKRVPKWIGGKLLV